MTVCASSPAQTEPEELETDPIDAAALVESPHTPVLMEETPGEVRRGRFFPPPLFVRAGPGQAFLA